MNCASDSQRVEIFPLTMHLPENMHILHWLYYACSEEIIHPEVPHSLRLQGILVGGIVVVFTKQQNYLLGESEHSNCSLGRLLKS
jgi:hypothetical protein